MERTKEYSIDEIKLIEKNWYNLHSDVLLIARLMNQIHPEMYVLKDELVTIDFYFDNKSIYVYSRKYNCQDNECLEIPIQYLSYDDEQIKTILIKEKEEYDSMIKNKIHQSEEEKRKEDYELYIKLKNQFENHV